MDRDRNLLFGVLAVQLKRITPSQLVDVAAAWAGDPSKDLPLRLVEAGIMSDKDQILIRQMVDAAVAAHGGNAGRTLVTFGGEDQVQQSFRGCLLLSGDDGVKAASLTTESVRSVEESPGRYTYVSEYGRGGMGRVLLVQDEFLGREIALKELLPDSPGEPAGPTPSPVRASVPVMARFLQEARITGQLEHPSIVPVYELGYRNDGTLYYTMKLVRGRTLQKAIRDAADLEERLALLEHFADLCHAMAYAHSRGVIHRDIKPGNVMVGEFGETVVLDWGLGKVKGKVDIHAEEISKTLRAMNLGDEAAVEKTCYGEIMGTPAYMPPEQARGDLDAIDERSDIYSLGAVLYEILSGQAPFKGSSLMRTVYQAIHEDPIPVEEIEPCIAPELAAIYRRAMAKRPEHRYASARDLADDIIRFQTGALVKAYQYSRWDLFQRFARKHKAVMGLAAQFAAIVIAIVALSLMASRSQQQSKTAKAEAAYRVSIQHAVSRAEDGEYAKTVESLTAVPAEYRGNWEWRFLVAKCAQGRNLCYSGGQRVVPDPLGREATFSPDGRTVATWGGWGSGVMFWDCTTGEMVSQLSSTRTGTWAGFDRSGTKFIVEQGYDKTTDTPGVFADTWDIASKRLLRQDESINLFGEENTRENTLFPCEYWAKNTDISGMENPRGLAVKRDGAVRYLERESNGVILVKDASTRQEICRVNSSEPIFAGMFEPRGRYVLVLLQTPAYEHYVQKRVLYMGTEWGCVLSEDMGYRLLPVALFDADTGQALYGGKRPGYLMSKPMDQMEQAFSSDGQYLVSSLGNEKAGVWRLQDGELVLELKGHRDKVLDAAFSPDGTRIATSSVDGSVKIWDAANGQPLYTFTGHTQPVETVQFNANGSRVLSRSSNGEIKLWDVPPTPPSLTIPGRVLANGPNAFTQDGNRLLTVERERQAVLWNAATGEKMVELPEQPSPLLYASFVPGKDQAVTVGADGTVSLWNSASGANVLNLKAGINPIDEVFLSRSGRYLVLQNSTRKFEIHDLTTGTPVTLPAGKGASATEAPMLTPDAFHPDGRRVVLSLAVNPPENGQPRSYKPFARIVATGSDEDTLTVGASDSGLDVVPNHASFSPNGKYMVTANVAGIFAWDPETGAKIHGLEDWLEKGAIAFDPNSGCVAVWSNEIVWVYDLAQGTRRALIEVPRGQFKNVQFGPDGERLLTVSQAGMIVLWDVSAKMELLRFEGTDATFSPDHRILAVVSNAGDTVLYKSISGDPSPYLAVPTR